MPLSFLTTENSIILERIIRGLGSTGPGLTVVGERGLGKEALVRMLYARSPFHRRPFVKVNCPLLMPDATGASTTASPGRGINTISLFRQFLKGVLYLHGVDELDPGMQETLLALIRRRLLKSGAGTAIDDGAGGMMIFATATRPLEACVAAGQFNAELCGLISAVTIHVPPLRECPERIEPLVDYFIRHLPSVTPGQRIGRPTPAQLDRLRAQRWPGNVKALQQTVETAQRLRDWRAAIRRLDDHGGVPATLCAPDLSPGGVVLMPDFQIRRGKLATYLAERIGAEEMGLMDLVMADAFINQGG